MTDGRHIAASRFGEASTSRRGASSAAGIGLAVVLAGACGAVQPQKGNEQLALAEYDLARDANAHNRYREALGHVQKSLEIDAENADSQYLGAVVMVGFCAADEHSSDCRLADAERYARKAIDVNPNHRDAKNTLGVILINQKRFDEAIAVLKPLANDILYQSPENSWGNLGWAYLERGNTDEAIDALRRALAAQPLFCVGSYHLGVAYEKKGENNLARQALTRAVETDAPECRRLQHAYYARARVEKKLGLGDEARRDLEHCRDLASGSSVGTKCAADLVTP